MDFTNTGNAIAEYYRACIRGPEAFEQPGPQQISSLQARWFDRTVAMHTSFVRDAFFQDTGGVYTREQINRMTVQEIQGCTCTIKCELAGLGRK